MKKNLLIILTSVFIWAIPLKASFEDLGFGARSFTLGVGFIALSDDVSAIFYNPAGIAQFKYNEAMLSFTRLYWGLGRNNPVDDENMLYLLSAGYIHKLNIFRLGIGYHRFGLVNYYNENTAIFSAGTEIKKIIKSFKKINLSLGLNLKLFYKSFAKDIYTDVNPIFVNNGYDKKGFGIDIGLIYKLQNLSLGTSFKNIFSSDMGLQNEDKINMRIGLGTAYTFDGKSLIRNSNWLNKLTLLAGLKFDDNNFFYGIGIESWFLSKAQLGVRTSFQVGNREYYSINFGLSYNSFAIEKKIVRIDYGFNYPLSGISSTYGTHSITLNLKF